MSSSAFLASRLLTPCRDKSSRRGVGDAMKRGLAIAAPSRPARSPRSEDGGECYLGDRGGGGLAVKQANFRLLPPQSIDRASSWLAAISVTRLPCSVPCCSL